MAGNPDAAGNQPARGDFARGRWCLETQSIYKPGRHPLDDRILGIARQYRPIDVQNIDNLIITRIENGVDGGLNARDIIIFYQRHHRQT